MTFGKIQSPASSLIKNQDVLIADKKRINDLINAVGDSLSQLPCQWIQLMAFALEFKPDIIIELGRGYGNSTCAFTEVCHLMAPDSCEVVSLCISKNWDFHTAPRLKKIVSEEWFKPLRIFRADIIDFDFKQVLSDKKKVLVFWDAHGFDIAESVLGSLLPLISDREHLVMMHDLSDNRYNGEGLRFYRDKRLWKGRNDFSGPRVWIDNIESCVEQAVAITDFSKRNGISLHSSDESYFTEIDDKNWKTIVETYGADYVSRNGHWFWFSLNESDLEYTFPRVKTRNAIESIRAKAKIAIISQAGHMYYVISKIMGKKP
jgi:cephalosporin hydroxylase